MKITGNFEVLRSQLFEEIKELQRKKASALQELNKVESAIADQRRGKSEVTIERDKLSKEISEQEYILSVLKSLADKEQYEFANLTTKQRSKIIELNDMITLKTQEREEYKDKERTMIDIDKVNREHKERMNTFEIEYKNAQVEKRKVEQWSSSKEKELHAREENILLKESILKAREEKLKHRENNQDIKEKRWKEGAEERRKFINLKKK